ncbi:MAG: methylation-associated defense system protein MAD4 [Lentisphaeria bacterium]|jgi:hypothetical protein
MRDCIFLLADKNMKAAFEGFLTRESFCQSLGCGIFDFDPCQDIAVASGDSDPGLYVRGHELLRPYQATHRYAVVVLDAEWEGSPGKEAIIGNLTENIKKTGWKSDCFVVIAIEPELENWIWQQSDHVAKGLGFNDSSELMANKELQAAWPQGQPKPTSPKDILEKLLLKRKIPRSSALYKKITSKVSIKRCLDSEFQRLCESLRTWFPRENR